VLESEDAVELLPGAAVELEVPFAFKLEGPFPESADVCSGPGSTIP